MVTLGMALRLIAHQKIRTAVGVSGIAFALLFIFLQLGFSGALTATAVAVSSHLEGELVLVSTRFLHVAGAGSSPRSRLFQAMAVPGVASVTPRYMRFARWKSPAGGSRCSMFTVGFPVSGPPPRKRPGLAEAVPRLAAPG